MASLWGEEFDIDDTVSKNKKIINKLNKPIVAKTKKALNPSKLDIVQRLSAISDEVNRILGTYKENTQVIYSLDEFSNYILDVYPQLFKTVFTKAKAVVYFGFPRPY